MVFKPAFVILYTSGIQSAPPFQTSITVSGRTWGMGERQGEKRREGKRGGGWREERGRREERRRRHGEEERSRDLSTGITTKSKKGEEKDGATST